MEEKVFRRDEEPNSIIMTYRKAQAGDKKAIEAIIQIFDKDISYYSKYIPLPREEAKQILISELIEIIKSE